MFQQLAGKEKVYRFIWSEVNPLSVSRLVITVKQFLEASVMKANAGAVFSSAKVPRIKHDIIS